MNMLKYSTYRYDENLLLKVPPFLWLCILYGIRHYFFVGAAFLMPMDVVSVPLINMQSSAWFMLTDVPAVLVLLAIGHRTPDGLNFMRWIWMNGRWLLVSSYSAGIAVFIYTNKDIMSDPNSLDFTEGLLVLSIDFAIIGYLFMSGLVLDVFKDLPSSK